jgi:hypothetical protein
VRAVRATCGALLLLGAASGVRAQLDAGPYVPTPAVIVDRMLELARIRPDDVVMDLGSGDGRIPIEAVTRHGARAGVGIDIDARLVDLANANAAAAGVGDRVKFVRGDLFETRLGGATVVTTYLLPNMVTRLVPKMLDELPVGARVVAHDYPLSPWPHDRVVSFELAEKIAISGSARTVLYHYTVPARIAGAWTLDVPAGRSRQALPLAISQRDGRTTAVLTVAGRETPVTDFRVIGDQVWFTLPAAAGGRVLEGRVVGDAIEGTAAPRWRAVRTAPATPRQGDPR